MQQYVGGIMLAMISAVLLPLIVYANYHYWFVLTPEERKLTDDDWMDLQMW